MAALHYPFLSANDFFSSPMSSCCAAATRARIGSGVSWQQIHPRGIHLDRSLYATVVCHPGDEDGGNGYVGLVLSFDPKSLTAQVLTCTETD